MFTSCLNLDYNWRTKWIWKYIATATSTVKSMMTSFALRGGRCLNILKIFFFTSDRVFPPPILLLHFDSGWKSNLAVSWSTQFLAEKIFCTLSVRKLLIFSEKFMALAVPGDYNAADFRGICKTCKLWLINSQILKTSPSSQKHFSLPIWHKRRFESRLRCSLTDCTVNILHQGLSGGLLLVLTFLPGRHFQQQNIQKIVKKMGQGQNNYVSSRQYLVRSDVDLFGGSSRAFNSSVYRFS